MVEIDFNILKGRELNKMEGQWKFGQTNIIMKVECMKNMRPCSRFFVLLCTYVKSFKFLILFIIFFKIVNHQIYLVYTELFLFDCRKLLACRNTLEPFLDPVLSNECKVSCSKKQPLAPNWVWTHAASDP